MTDEAIDYGKMDPELKAKWVEALRSGQYSQGKGYLERISSDNVRSNCCLGVLCRIMDVPTRDDNDIVSFAFNADNINYYLASCPPDNFAGITTYGIHQCTIMNDNTKLTFAQIADWIEKNL